MKTYLPAVLCFTTLLFFSPLLVAQNPLPTPFACGGDVMQQALWKKHPELAAAQAALDAQLAQVFRQKENDVAARAAAAPLVLPVVVHIIHNGGSENISDAQVAAAIQHLNDAFAHTDYYGLAGAGVETGIQFCLARRTPDGQPTNGINRIVSTLTMMDMETDDLPLKDLSRWDPTRYVNIWVVQSINSLSSGPGVAGYAYFPSSHGRPEDGMVCEAQLFGVSPEKDAVLIHEMGHYLALYHTFEGGCKNDDCLVDGDRVCDTPPDQAKHTACPFNSCTTDTDAPAPNPFTTDGNDMTENFMDYSPFECVYRFTQGQTDRMLEAVTTVRKSLLESDGCKDACSPMVHADFSVSPAGGGQAGVAATFNNMTTGGVSYQWFVDAALVSTAANGAYTFNFPGVFSIKLLATNGPQGCVDSFSMGYVVTCPVESAFTADKTSIKEGESVLFTSTATGGGTLEWFINGVSVGSGLTLNFIFPTEGTYNVVLRTTGAVCSDNFSIPIKVLGACAVNNPQLLFTPDSGGGLTLYDMETLPNGNMIACGITTSFLGVAVMFNSKGDVVWCKRAGPAVTFWTEIVIMPDGTFAFWGFGKVNGVDNRPHVTQINTDGDVLKFLVLEAHIPGGNISYNPERNYLVVDPDGTLTASIVYNNIPDVLTVKFRLDGTVLWSKKFANMSQSDLLKPGDGSSGYLLTRSFLTLTEGVNFEVFQLDANGNMIKSLSYKPVIPVNEISYHDYHIVPHPDGGYAIVCKSNSLPANKTNLLRCAGDGSILWSNHYITGAHSYSPILHYFNGKGWLLSEIGKINGVNSMNQTTLLRIQEDGSLFWSEKFRNLFTDEGSWGTLAREQAGRIRLLGNYSYRTTPLLGNLPDSSDSAKCLTEPENTTVLTNQKTHTIIQASSLQVNDISITTSLTSLSVTDFLLNPIVLCATSYCPEICDNGKDDNSDGFIDCFDQYCKCFDGEDCLVNNLDPDATIEGKLAWRTGEGIASVNSSPIIANLNPQTDSIPEIIVVRANSATFRIFKGDGSDIANPSLLVPTAGFAWNGNYPVIGDINKDGIPEFITVENDSKVRVYRNFIPGNFPCMTLWMTSDLPTADTKQRPMLADFDQDGQPEVYAGNDVFRFDFSNPAAPQLLLTLNGVGHSGLANTIGTNLSTAADLLTPADCNGDPDCEGLELVAGSVIYAVDLDLLDGDGFQIKVVKDLNVLQTTYKFSDGYTAVADMDLDGTPDIVVSGQRGPIPNVYIWNKNGLVYSFNVPVVLGSSFRGVAAIANVFIDNTSGIGKDYPEIIMVGNKTMACFNLHRAAQNPNAPYWWIQPNTDESGYTGCTVFDFNGDGIQEIVYRDQSDLRIMYGGAAPFPPGVDAERNWWKTTVGSITLDEIPVIADVDNDGHADIAVTGFDKPFVGPQPTTFDGRLQVFKSAKIPWMPCRPIWNQLNYNHVNINDDLTVPRVQQKHWLEFPGPGGGKYPFNTALAQLSSLNSTFTTGYPVPDVSVTLDTFFCAPNGLSLRIHLCNTGSTAYPDSIPLQFYGKNPTATPVIPYGNPFFLNGKLAKDSCRTWNINLPMPSDGTLWGIVNDNGSLPAPFNLTQNFPSTAQPECNYTNNIFNLNISFPTSQLDLGPDRILCSSSVSTLYAAAGFARYRWNDGSPDSSFTAFGPGTYWVDAWDICGKKYSDTLRITLQNTTLELGPDRNICLGDSIQLALTGFDKVQWSPRPVFGCPDCAVVTLAPDSTVVLRVSGQLGNCIVSDSMRVQVRDFPVLTAAIVNGNCLLENSSIALTAAGGNAGLTFKWENGQTTAAIDSLPSGIYRVTISNALGCSVSKTYEILAGGSPLLSDTSYTSIRCFSDKNGGIAVTPAGGAAPYSFTWSHDPTATGSNLTALAAGTYLLTLTDANGCSSIASFQLAEPSALALMATMDPTDCQQTTASIATSGAGGTAPYTYLWNTGAQTPDLNNQPPGQYSVVITDINGCTTSRSFEVKPGSSPLLTDTVLTAIRCFSEKNGGISVTASGGAAPYDFDWSHNAAATGNSQTGLAAGNYGVTITDANGCSSIASFQLTEPTALALTATMDSTDCQQTTASIATSGAGGTAPYTYLWNTGAQTPDLNNQPPGQYSVVITDINGCTTSRSFEVKPGSSPLLTDTVLTAIRCFSEKNGGISVTATGGAAPYDFDWSHNAAATGNSQTGLTAGTYGLTITDTKGCSSTATFQLTEPTALLLMATMDSTDCQQTTASIATSGAGGTAPYTYLWNTGAQTPDLNNQPPGQYSVVITDLNGCTTSRSFEVKPGSSPLLTDTVLTAIRCFSEKNGGISVTATGGAAPYDFDWSHNAAATGNSQTGLAAGNYGVTITDTKGCSSTATFQLTEPPVLLLTATMDSTDCQQTTASISTSATGGSAPYTYAWNTGAKTADLNNQPPGLYSLVLTDANGCSSTRSFEVKPGGSPTLNLTGGPLNCLQTSATLTAGPVLPNYIFQWTAPDGSMLTGPQQQVSQAGLYRVTVTDLSGQCSATSSIEVQQAEEMTALNWAADSVTCFGFQDGVVHVLDIEGGTAPFEFSIDNQSFVSDSVFGQLAAGTYTLRVRDAAGCTFEQTVQVSEPAPLSVILTASDTLVRKDAVVQLTASVTPPNRFLTSIIWQPLGLISSNGLTAEASLALPALFQIQVSDEHGCTALDSVRVKVKQGSFYFPNVIAPDRPNNGGFTIYADHPDVRVKWLRVYSRWGELIFERSNFPAGDASLGWQGDFKGQKVQAGVYIFTATVVLEDGSEEQLEGDVTVF